MSVFLLLEWFENGDEDGVCRHLGGVKWGDAQCSTYIASSKFLSAMALLPRALSSSAEAMVEDG